MVLPGTGRRALGPPGRRTMQPGSFRATPYTPYDVVLVGANQRTLDPSRGRPMRPIGPSKAALRQAAQSSIVRGGGRRRKMPL